MKYTLREYYNKCFTEYYMKIDNKGKMKEGKGIIPYSICKDTEKIMRDYLSKHKRKNDMHIRVLYSNERKEVCNITLIGKREYNNKRIGWCL